MGSSLKPSPRRPRTPADIPEITTKSDEELIRNRAIVERIRRAAFTGTGRAATIFTSQRGIPPTTRSRSRGV